MTAASERISLRRSAWIVFSVLVGFGLIWSLYTQHVWEDYYITYRASKNLAIGNGLTFTAGERVHSFTSPLGVLLPALASLLTGNGSDDGALWIFRFFSISAYAGAGVLLWLTFQNLFPRSWVAIVMVAVFGLESKIVDFSTNGMETGLLLFFLAWMVHACFTHPPRSEWHIGLAWAGLMWSRPDSFIYIGVFGLGLLLMPFSSDGMAQRRAWFRKLIMAGLITTAVYLPWIIWATVYYGTPIPHTVVAKGFGAPARGLMDYVHMVLNFPAQVRTQIDMLRTIYMPPYSHNTGWPALAQTFSVIAAVASLGLWLVPGVRREIRITSFTFLGGLFYLMNTVGFPIPWYLPTITTFSILTLALLAAQLTTPPPAPGPAPARLDSPMLRRGLTGLIAALAVGAVVHVTTISTLAAHQMHWQQKLVERGNREKMGRWLKANAASVNDTVFLEPLGYIGFYSGLKMLDYPGLSSPEVVAARQKIAASLGSNNWPGLIFELRPTWLVLRDYESRNMRAEDPELLSERYQLAEVFDVRDKVAALPRIAGRGYLINDAYFEIYHINLASFARDHLIRRVRLTDLLVNEAGDSVCHVSGRRFGAHSPSRLIFAVPPAAATFVGNFGFEDSALAHFTDGAGFVVNAIAPDGTSTEVMRRYLDPLQRETDRGRQALQLPVDPTRIQKIELIIDPGPTGNAAADWTYWSELEFGLREQP